MKTVNDIVPGTILKCSLHTSLFPELMTGVVVTSIVEKMDDWVWVRVENQPYKEPILVTNKGLADGRFSLVGV
jgi:hypothetical protein